MTMTSSRPAYDPEVVDAANPSPETRRGWIIAGAILTVLAIGGALVQMYFLVSLRTGSDSKTYPGALSSLMVTDAGSSDIQIIADDSVDGARVDRDMRWSGSSSDKPGRSSTFSDGVLKIGNECAGTSNCSIDYRIYVNPQVQVTADSSSGDVVVRGTTGALKASASSGDIRLTAITGDVTASASSGDVVVEDTKGDLDLEASSGDIRASGVTAGVLQARADSGDIHVDLAKDADNISLNADSGSIYLTVPGLKPYDVQAAASSGSTQVDIPIDSGSGRPLIAKASSGDIRIEQSGA